jgi:dipeptidyl aminopeptidase/acylaminoacyl peptidase
MATILANNGYITLASDYRGHGRSEGQGEGHQPEYAIDVLYLLASVKNIEKADANRVGMWGHSMGGETSLRTVEATDAIKALVLWAPTLGGGHSSDTSLMDNLTKIETPISLHQGLSDTEVDPETSIILSDALKKEGKQLEYFEYEGQDHNFRNLGWDLISERTLDFYNKHLK